MMLSISYNHCSISMEIEPAVNELEQLIRSLFQFTENVIESPNHVLRLSKRIGYLLYVDGLITLETHDTRKIIYAINECVRGCIRQELRHDEILIHSSMFSLDNSNVLLIGASGAGKTSLACMLNEQGLPCGDEYVWLMPTTGLARPENLPLLIKEIGVDAITSYVGQLYPIVSANDSLSFLAQPSIPQSKRLHYIVFLEYDQTKKVQISYPKIELLHQLSLPSMLIKGERHHAYRMFLEYLDNTHARILYLQHSDIYSAAKELQKFLEKASEPNSSLSNTP